MSALTRLSLAAATALLASCATTASHYYAVGPRMPSEVIDSSAAWAALDLNNDGVLSIDEIEQARAIAMLQDFANADADHDGNVAKAEWEAWWPRMTDHHVSDDATPLPLADMAP
ncbi:MAG: EF-hand domain-containing protein [Rhodanobacteraceae bacterium]